MLASGRLVDLEPDEVAVLVLDPPAVDQGVDQP
jgi:hypothetical protein